MLLIFFTRLTYEALFWACHFYFSLYYSEKHFLIKAIYSLSLGVQSSDAISKLFFRFWIHVYAIFRKVYL